MRSGELGPESCFGVDGEHWGRILGHPHPRTKFCVWIQGPAPFWILCLGHCLQLKAFIAEKEPGFSVTCLKPRAPVA